MGVNGIAVGVEKVKSGVGSGSVGAGGVYDSGVDACSVANRSGVGEEAAGRLHPALERMKRKVKQSLTLWMVRFD